MNGLPTVRAELLLHKLDDQTLVYDSLAGRVHLLDRTSGSVLEVLRSPDPTISKALESLPVTVDGASAKALLALSIEELRKADLLAGAPSHNRALPDLTRRRLLKTVTVAGISALLIPAISTLTAVPAQAQGSCLPIGSPCTATSQCCNGSNGAPHCHHIGSDPPGNFCHNT